jgi:hypothetical protein
MCFCESDAVKILIHVKARKRFPGIRFHEASLEHVARTFAIRTTADIRAMGDAALHELSQALLCVLPPAACPLPRKEAG